MPSVTPAAGKRGTVTINSGAATHLIITATAGTGMYRLTEGTHTGFMAGDGVPQIIVRDPDRTLQLVTDKTLSDYQITLEETG